MNLFYRKVDARQILYNDPPWYMQLAYVDKLNLQYVFIIFPINWLIYLWLHFERWWWTHPTIDRQEELQFEVEVLKKRNRELIMEVAKLRRNSSNG